MIVNLTAPPLQLKKNIKQIKGTSRHIRTPVWVPSAMSRGGRQPRRPPTDAERDLLADAIESDDGDAVSRLLASRVDGAVVDPDVPADDAGNLPLSLCAWADASRATAAVIAHGANVDARDVGGNRATPVYCAASAGSARVLALLLDASADPTISGVRVRDYRGGCPPPP